jgi:hypothetical protein
VLHALLPLLASTNAGDLAINAYVMMLKVKCL